MDRTQIHHWLTCTEPDKLTTLWHQADEVRRRHVGEDVYLRGLIEVSNDCSRRCGYCGISADNTGLERYLMSHDEILACAEQGNRLGYGTVVLQAGETRKIDSDWVAELITRIKKQTGQAVTLSLGERSHDELKLWHDCGADRYLLRFETSNRELFDQIHPPVGKTPSDRIALLEALHEIGYAPGSGMLIGIPGQSYDDLVNDLLLLKRLNLHMIGIGPYVPDPQTPLGQKALSEPPAENAVIPSEDLTYRVLALARILCPGTNIPSTTAVATLFGSQGQDLGLQRGANILMPNITPPRYRALYTIYPAKACLIDPDADGANRLRLRIERIGRRVGTGRGDAAPTAFKQQMKGSR